MLIGVKEKLYGELQPALYKGVVKEELVLILGLYGDG